MANNRNNANNGGKAPAQLISLDIVKLKDGDVVAGWTMVCKLGEGGFGAVYKVKDPNGTLYAMKTEKATETVRVLKMEVLVLRAAKKKRSQHFCDMIDAGRVGSFNYVVMTLVGPSLHDVRKQIPESQKQKFSLGCAVSVSLKCMQAVQEVHEIGFLHRDIKPGNFAIGVEDPRRIYILDFGMCRHYLDNESGVRKPRWAAGFRGTLRYAAISAHISREMCRKDDLETWLYQTIELTKGGLPWKHLDKVEEVCRYKESCRGTGLQELFGGCPREYILIMKYIDSLRYYDTPDYAHLESRMREVITKNKLQEYPYDWEMQTKAPPSKIAGSSAKGSNQGAAPANQEVAVEL